MSTQNDGEDRAKCECGHALQIVKHPSKEQAFFIILGVGNAGQKMWLKGKRRTRTPFHASNFFLHLLDSSSQTH